MKVIDQTPFFKPDGKINMIDQAKATMKLGGTWVQETQAQTGVMAALDRGLDKRFTLLRNVTLQGLDISIPFILVGPTGIYAMYVTALRGMYRAKGDLWGTLSGNTFKPASINLLTRTARMARAIQVYLQRQGYEGVGMVDSALLCADPGLHVDSVRPIVRVVQSDALERFAVSIAQARDTISPGAVTEVVNRILNPKPAKVAEQAESVPGIIPTAAATPEEEPYVPTFALPAEQTVTPIPPVEAGGLGFEFQEDAAPIDETPFGAPIPSPAPSKAQVQKTRRGFSSRQWVILILFAAVECIALVIFIYIIYMQNR
jgi:hypothetical protein